MADSSVVAEPGGADDLEEAAAVFTSLRPRLFGIAYRMLGSASEAEDLVQDVWLRWQAYDRAAVVNPGAFLATTATRLAINALQSARARRETYIGPWLPEPVDTSADPYLGAERGAALELATLVLMEKLTLTERAAYVLREAFDYPYGAPSWCGTAATYAACSRSAPRPRGSTRSCGCSTRRRSRRCPRRPDPPVSRTVPDLTGRRAPVTGGLTRGPHDLRRAGPSSACQSRDGVSARATPDRWSSRRRRPPWR
ncbi:sigma factor [Phytohabitans sp. ZYX-F-186]|uniref:Sigma factor n=1 Tax=Phytohabitans maris TaxID=3071409 RepID=A0ABU0ZG93_9ACTN|nr:sigma factor [Phytohabitans sp. ZYX-F-186]MDQ7906072.1 sigma factor [Phytohabitans sp. ZYX-F-186]